jgi:site-specific DNA-methyltransferase (adenine-specific)
MTHRIERIGDAELHLADCRDVLPTLSGVDAVVTDPPYGVNLGARTGSSRYLNERYASTDDTPKYIASVCVPAITTCLYLFGRVAMTPGNRCMWMYPQPDDVGIWYNPASTNRGRWGFSYASAFIFYYGRDPHNVGNGMRPNSVAGACDPVDGIDHPCPKPLLFMRWMVERASLAGDTVLDPFMGSGTTGVACAQLGRRFIGCEIEPKYFDIACKRIEEATKQGDLIRDVLPKPQQKAMEL